MPPQREHSTPSSPGENPESVPSKVDLAPRQSQAQSPSVDKTGWSKNILAKVASSNSFSNASNNQTARAARRYKIIQHERVGAVISNDTLISGQGQDIDCSLTSPKILGALLISTLLLTLILLLILKWLNLIEMCPKRLKGGASRNLIFESNHGFKHAYDPTDCEASALPPIQESICPETSVRIDNMNGSGLTTNSKYIIHSPRDRVRKLSHVGKFPISTEKLHSYISPLWDNGPRKRSFENMRPQNAPPSGSFV
ncbi:uncharacterized protein LOC131883805 isoform X2 [Tigriopus californicus]|uniref:uncharacterized protein LOC131883805 isoform X2 n=1 Tax=Tigriopus californicus TaxID=6832 RepID=UPI0027DA06F3|nr:uncharacterized protein LOC131883805 isoform X2 [Tigriopus californicus]